MSGEHLSAATRALLRAAKADAPGAAARAKVWSGVTGTVGAVGGAAGASGAAGAGGAGIGAASAAAGGMGAMKMLVLGTLLGGAVTVGLAATMLQIGPSPRDVPTTSTAPVFAAANAATGLAGIDPPAVNIAPVVTPAATAPAPIPATPVVSTVLRSHPRPRPPAHPAPAVARPGPAVDPLAREASLVADARAALARGDAQTALRTVRAARAMPSPQLVPEELAVEGQALRLLGSADEARGVDETLRTTYPESALAH